MGNSGIKMACSSCAHQAVGDPAHLGRRHKRCGEKHKSGDSRKGHGTWQSAGK